MRVAVSAPATPAIRSALPPSPSVKHHGR